MFCAIAKVTPVKKVTDVISVQFHRTKGISCTGEGIQVVYEKLKPENPKAKTLIFYCMYDVVPVTPEEWTFPPFAAEIVNAEKVKLPAILYLFES